MQEQLSLHVLFRAGAIVEKVSLHANVSKHCEKEVKVRCTNVGRALKEIVYY